MARSDTTIAQPELRNELCSFGALPQQIVDLGDGDPRLLNYLDLQSTSPHWRTPLVVEHDGRPCLHVFDGRQGESNASIQQWCWRIALRGDGAWVGVLRPGRLDVYKTELAHDTVRPIKVASSSRQDWILPKFLVDASTGQDDVARRRFLTRLLVQSAKRAVEQGLSMEDAVSLIGRALFWRFLVDRGLLAGLKPQDVCSTANTWENCLDAKTRALRTFAWLENTFNGGLLPFEGDPARFSSTVYSGVVGNIAYGTTETGQLRLPSDWRDLNFAYIPVGLLSEVYEAFAYSMDSAEATRSSVHYTPSHLVQFVIEQALASIATHCRPRILDPAAGAGVFLVAAFRKLVEREWRLSNRRPTRRTIRRILNTQLVGFDTDPRALRLAELALYLTALELDADARTVDRLRFRKLRGTVLVDVSDRAQGSLGPVSRRFRSKFDLVVGNPPWTARGGEDKAAWVKHTKATAEVRLGVERAATFDFPDTNADLPFVWRALEWAKPSGRIALMTHARWLFGASQRAIRARRDLMESVRITGILNGSALRLSEVWPSVSAPWCVVFANNDKPEPTDSAAFQFVSPRLHTESDGEQSRLKIDWLDSHIVPTKHVLSCPWALKSIFRGNGISLRALERMRQSSVTLGGYLESIGPRTRKLRFRSGYQVGRLAGAQVSASHMIGMPDTKGMKEFGAEIATESLPKFQSPTLLRSRDPRIYEAPLLLVRKSIPHDPLTVRVSRADANVAYHESMYGLSLADTPDAGALSRYLQVCLQSGTMVFCALMMDGQYAVERDAIYMELLESLPIIPLSGLSASQHERLQVLSRDLEVNLTRELAWEIDEFVLDTFELSPVDKQAVHDALDVSLPSTTAKLRAARPPTEQERSLFKDTLLKSLAQVMSAKGVLPTIRERHDLPNTPWRIMEVEMGTQDKKREGRSILQQLLSEADQGGASLIVLEVGRASWVIGMLDRYFLWTPTRARLLATELFAGGLH